MGTSINNILCYNSTSTVLAIKKPCKASHQSSSFDPLFQAGIPNKNAGTKFGRSHGFLEFQRTSWTATPTERRRSKLDFAVYCSPQPENFLPFLPVLPSSDSWLTWLLGLITIVPFVTQGLLTLTKQVDATAEAVEKIADTVGKVAEDVEKVAEDMAEKLPEGGKLRNLANFVENIAEETAKDAQLVEDLMDKVEELDDEIESIINNNSKETVKVANNEK